VERFETELKVSNSDQTTTTGKRTVGNGIGAGGCPCQVQISSGSTQKKHCF
jgi:hypothetical protein